MMLKKALYSIMFLTLTPIVFYYFWFAAIPTLVLVMDEVPWILDSQFYTHRQNRDWEKFSLTNDFRILQWEEPKRRLLDQPQFGKYLIGFLLEISGQPAIQESERYRLYNLIHTDKLPVGNSLSEASSILNPEITYDILIIRYAAATAGLMAIILLAWIACKVTHSGKIGVFVVAFCLWHPLLRSAFLIATTDPFFVLFLSGSASLMFLLLTNLNRLSTAKILLASILLGVLNALTASIKLPGAFLALFPPLYFSISLISSSQQTCQSQQLKKICLCLGSFVFSFLLVFYYLEPEFWGHPLQGTTALFGSRILQQERFYRFFGKFTWLEMPMYLITILIMPTHSPWSAALLIILLFVGFAELWKKGTTNTQYRLLFYFLVYWVIVNTTYGRVKLPGFERYLIPTLFIFTLVISVGLSTTLSWLAKSLRSLEARS